MKKLTDAESFNMKAIQKIRTDYQYIIIANDQSKNYEETLVWE